MLPLEDGVYEVVVIDAQEIDAENAARVELVITAGPRKGELVALRATHLDRDALSMLGLPGTLSVDKGMPSFVPG
jgi:hypothetical protein